MTKVLMVKGWKSNATWGFPRGKINKDEPDDVCAIREVFEEIGFDISPYLVPEDFIDITIRQKNFKLYIIRGVPGNTKFCPQTRKEISKIEWHDVKTLPAFSSESKVENVNQYFLVAPFMQELAKYIAQKRGLPSSISQSEAEALKNLLGVTSPNQQGVNSNIPVDKDAAAAELLSILKSTDTKTQSSDKNVLMGLLKNSTANTPSVSTPHAEMDHAKELLSLLKTEMDRLKEEDALHKATQNQIPYSNIPTGVPPYISPQVLPPQPGAYVNNMGYFMPPNVPVQMMPYNGMVPYPPPMFGIPVPGPPPPPPQSQQMLGQPPNVLGSPMIANSFPQQTSQPPLQLVPPSTSLTSSLPEAPHPPTSATLLALLAKNKGKKHTPKSPTASITQAPIKQVNHSSASGSSSKALLSLLHKPKIAAPTPPVPPEFPAPPPVLDENKNKADSVSLLNILKSKLPDSVPEIDPQEIIENGNSETDVKPNSSQTLLNMLKGTSSEPLNTLEPSNISSFPTLSSIESTLPPVEPTPAPRDSASAALLDLIRQNDNTPSPRAATPVNNGISIKDAIFKSFVQQKQQPQAAAQAPLQVDTQSVTASPRVSGFFTVSDLESNYSPAPAHSTLYNNEPTLNNSAPTDVSTVSNAGKDLLNLIQHGSSNASVSNLPTAISSNTSTISAAPSVSENLSSDSSKSESSQQLLSAIFASAPSAPSPSISSPVANGNAGNELLSLLKKGSATNTPQPVSQPTVLPEGQSLIRMPSPTQVITGLPDANVAIEAATLPAVQPKEDNAKSQSKALLDFLREYSSGSLNTR